MGTENLADMSEFILPTNSPVDGLSLFDGCNLEDFITADGEDLSMLELEPYQKTNDSPKEQRYSVSFQQSQEILFEASVISKPETAKHDATQYQQTEELQFLEESEHFVETQAVAEPNPALANPNWGNNFVQSFEHLSVNNFQEGTCLSPQVNNANESFVKSRKRTNQQDIEEILNDIKRLETMEKNPDGNHEDIRHKVKRKKNTVACRKSRQKKKEQEEANRRKIGELEQTLKQVEEESSQKLEAMKKQFGAIVQAMLQAGSQHVSTEAKNYIFTEWSKIGCV